MAAVQDEAGPSTNNGLEGRLSSSSSSSLGRQTREQRKARLLQELELLRKEEEELNEEQELINLALQVAALRKRNQERREEMNLNTEIAQKPKLSPRAQEKQPEFRDSQTFRAYGYNSEGEKVGILLKPLPLDPFAAPGLSEMQASSSRNHSPSPVAAESSSKIGTSWALERLEYYKEVDGEHGGVWEAFKHMNLDELRRLEEAEDSARPTQLASSIRYAIFLRTGSVGDLESAIDRAREEIPIKADDPEYAPRLKDLVVMLLEKYKQMNDPDALEESINRAAEMYISTDSDHPEREGRMRDWINLMFFRYSRTGQERDFNEAIQNTHEVGGQITMKTLEDGVMSLQIKISEGDPPNSPAAPVEAESVPSFTGAHDTPSSFDTGNEQVGNVEFTPHKCEHCQKLIFDPSKTREMYPILTQSSLFDITPVELASGAGEGCVLMEWILKYINDCERLSQPSRDGLVIKWDLSECDREDSDPESDSESSDRDLVLKMDIEDAEDDMSCIRHMSIWNKRTRPTWGIPNRSLFGIYTYPDNVAARYISARPICQTVSEEGVRLAANWLKECIESHPDCPKPDPFGGMPIRVIEISEDNGDLQARLYHPKVGESHPYIALSYCWGGPQPVTKTENKDKFAEAIPVQNLPKTIKDAIKTTWELGIKYLWVDALCIIQNDKDDTAQEIAKMPKIYGQALLTIMASRASSVHEGFLHNRTPTDPPHLACEVPYRCPDGQLGSIMLLSQDKEHVSEPLDSRGWTLQEYLLSTRILDFGTRQTRWTCPSTNGEQRYTDGWRQHPEKNNTRPGSLSILGNTCNQDDLKPMLHQLARGGVIGEWHDVLESYTARNLTVPKDRILAMSGIADRYGALFKDNYLAGLWKFALPYDLLWEWSSNSNQNLLPRPGPDNYQAPSWSWAAIPQKISFKSIEWKNRETRLEFINCKIELVNQEAPYGAVKYGNLTVKAPMREAFWIPERPHADAWTHTSQALTRRTSDGRTEVLAAYILPDALENEFAGSKKAASMPVYLLEILHDPSETDIKMVQPNPVAGIVLRKREDGDFSRLGVFFFAWYNFGGVGYGLGSEERNRRFLEQRRWFREAEMRVVTIV